jgi:large subunit ribosomal protein L2
MLFFSKINMLSTRFSRKPGSFPLQDSLFSNISSKKKTKFVLNKSPHVHKKSKERFTFLWPRRLVYNTPAFTDLFSLNMFVSCFLKKTSVFLVTTQFLFKTTVIALKKLMFFNYKSIRCGKKKISGRSNTGSITCWHRGGSHKKMYRFIDFFRRESSLIFIVCGFEYDPIRQSYLAVITSRFLGKTFFSRILAPKDLIIGSSVINFSSSAVSFNVGNSYYLQDIPAGSLVHCIEPRNIAGAKFVRSAGSFAQVIQKSSTVLVKLPSGRLFSFSPFCRCTFGTLSNENKNLVVLGKAGRSRWLGRRPTVRGVAINPVDHPHGGGEGKSQIGRHPVTPWGRLTKGKKTVKNKYLPSNEGLRAKKAKNRFCFGRENFSCACRKRL